MGPDVNSDKEDFYGTVTPDGQILMFNRTISNTSENVNVDIYWVDAEVISALKPK